MSIRDDAHLAVPRCPKCSRIDDMERLPKRHLKEWWCGACNLACDGSSAEHRAMSRAQAELDEARAARAKAGGHQ